MLDTHPAEQVRALILLRLSSAGELAHQRPVDVVALRREMDELMAALDALERLQKQLTVRFTDR